MYQTNQSDYWEMLLAAEGMPAELPSVGDVSLSGLHDERVHDLSAHYTTDESEHDSSF